MNTMDPLAQFTQLLQGVLLLGTLAGLPVNLLASPKKGWGITLFCGALYFCL